MVGLDLEAVRIRKPADIKPAAEYLRDFVRARTGFRVGICHNIAERGNILDADGALLATSVFGWGNSEADRWWRTPHFALESPIPAACRYESEPFWCNADGFRTSVPNRALDAIDLEHFVERCLTPAAIVVPVHLPFGQIGAASFQPEQWGKLDLSAEFAEHGDALGLITRTFVTSYVRTMCDKRRAPIGVMLSKREVQCLRWAAFGKTDLEISMILERSRATVRFHINNASRKLNAVNRSQTVFKAGQLGYIENVL